MTFETKHGLKIVKEVHNCKTDCCPDRGKTFYIVTVFGNKTTLSEPEFQEILEKFRQTGEQK